MDRSSSNTALSSKRESFHLPSSVYLITSNGRTLRLPIASRSSRDPLNWSRLKRAGAIASLFISYVTLWILQYLPFATLPAVTAEFGNQDRHSLPVDSALLANLLCMGLGAFLWGPLSLAVGRRAALLYSVLILVSGILWAGLTHDFVQLIVATAVQGFAEGSFVVILLALIDLTFIHQRPLTIGAIIAVSGFFVVGMISLAPQITLITSDRKKTFLLMEIPVMVSGLLVLFCVPETYFLRPALAFDGRVLVQGSTEKVEIYQDWDAAPVDKELPDLPTSKERSLIKLLKFWTFKGGSWQACCHCYIQVLFCCLQPLLFWVLVLRCLMATGLALVATTYPDILTNDPYRLIQSQTTIFNAAGVIGVLVSWPASSLVNTALVRYLSIRNKGIRKAQYYLPALLMPVVVMAAALVMYAFAVRDQLAFFYYCIAFFLVCFAYTAIEAAATIWVIEAFPRNAVAALTVSSGCSYPVAFGLSFAISPWIESQTLFGTGTQLATIIFALGVIGTSVAFWGEEVRQKLKGRWAKNEAGALRPQLSNRW